MYILQNFQDKQGFYLHEIYEARKKHIKQSNLEKYTIINNTEW